MNWLTNVVLIATGSVAIALMFVGLIHCVRHVRVGRLDVGDMLHGAKWLDAKFYGVTGYRFCLGVLRFTVDESEGQR